MTNEEAIEELMYLKHMVREDSNADKALDRAIEALEQNQWIPCSVRLPEKADSYICTCTDGHRTMVTCVKWQNKLKRWDLTGARSFWRVRAWMPLPESYRGDKDGE